MSTAQGHEKISKAPLKEWRARAGREKENVYTAVRQEGRHCARLSQADDKGSPKTDPGQSAALGQTGQCRRDACLSTLLLKPPNADPRRPRSDAMVASVNDTQRGPNW